MHLAYMDSVVVSDARWWRVRAGSVVAMVVVSVSVFVSLCASGVCVCVCWGDDNNLPLSEHPLRISRRLMKEETE